MSAATPGRAPRPPRGDDVVIELSDEGDDVVLEVVDARADDILTELARALAKPSRPPWPGWRARGRAR